MKKVLFLFVLSFFTMSLFAQTIVSTSPENKKIILEEFTGIHCGYCPDGHVKAQAIQDAHPDDVFLINIHTGGYAAPGAGEPDFRTDFGSAIAGQSGLTGYPAGTINRHVFSGHQQGSGTAMGRFDWSSASNIALAEASYINVAVETEIDKSSRVATIHVEAYYTGDSPETTNLLSVSILQDNTLGPQSSGGMGDNYNHMHRLITMPTGQWGVEIPTTTTGTFVDETFEFTIPVNSNGVPIILDDLKLVAFVSETHQEIISGNACLPTFVGVAPTSDISLDQITVDDMVCSSGFPASVTISNFGTTDINSLAITYQVNSETAEVYNWSGTLNSLETTTIELPEVTYTPEGTNTFEVTIESDDNDINNTLTAEVTDALAGITYIKIQMETGDNGDQFAWQLRESDGTLIDYGSGYEDNTSISEYFELSEDCYKLEFFDSGENGGTSITIMDSYTELYTISGDWGLEGIALFKTEITEVIEETIPATGSTGVSISNNLYIDFQQPVRYIDNSSISNMNPDLPVTFSDNTKTAIPFSLFMNIDKTKLTIKPEEDLDLFTEYTVTLDGGVLENYYDIEITDDITFSFTTGDGVGITETNNEINIFPNPATNLLNVTNIENADIQIFNIVGELVISTKETSIDVSTLATGTYIVKIISENNITTKKVNISH